MACPGCCSACKRRYTATHALFISPPLHLSLVPSILVLLITSVVHNQAPGPEMYCQKGACDPIFPVVEVLLARLDNRRVLSATTQRKTRTLTAHGERHTTCSLITKPLGFISATVGVVPVQPDNKSTHRALWSDRSR